MNLLYVHLITLWKLTQLKPFTSSSLSHSDVLKQFVYTSLFDYKIAFFKTLQDLPSGSSLLLYGCDYGEFLQYSQTVSLIKKKPYQHFHNR